VCFAELLSRIEAVGPVGEDTLDSVPGKLLWLLGKCNGGNLIVLVTCNHFGVDYRLRLDVEAYHRSPLGRQCSGDCGTHSLILAFRLASAPGGGGGRETLGYIVCFKDQTPRGTG
jgi:hypothetical protein